MWKAINVEGRTRFMKYVREKDCHQVYFSDAVNLWKEELTSSSLSKRCKEMNSLIEAEPEVLAKHVHSLIVDSKAEAVITDADDGEAKEINMESQIAGIPFYFVFKMKRMGAEMVCREVTMPLVLLAVKQQAYLSHLQDLLHMKDAEIQQYKLEGAVLKKRKLETDPFDENFEHQMNVEMFHADDMPNIPDLFAKLCPQLPTSMCVQQDTPNSNVKAISPEPEEKHTNSSLMHLVPETSITVTADSVSNIKTEVKAKVPPSKKTKLRI